MQPPQTICYALSKDSFHVSLNAAEDAVTTFSSTSLRSSLRLFLEQIFHTSPKHTRLHCAWPLLYWDCSKSKIKFFRNLESAKTMNMFLSYIYLNMYFPWYSSNITSLGVVTSYNIENLMAQMAVIFICWSWEGRTLQQIDLVLSKWYGLSKSISAKLLDKKTAVPLPDHWEVEIFHSLFRENTREHNDAKSLSEIAKVIASSGFLSVFKEGFIPLYQRGTSENNLWLLTGKTAEFLLNLFKKISNNSGKAPQGLSLQ